MRLGKFLRPAMDAGDVAEAQGLPYLIQKADALAQAVQQREIGVLLYDSQRDPGEAGAGAHVNHSFAGERLYREEGEAVQQVEPGDLVGLGDGGQVHHLVPFQQHIDKFLQVWDTGIPYTQGREPDG